MEINNVGVDKVSRLYSVYGSNNKIININNAPAAKDRIEISEAGKKLSCMCSDFQIGQDDSKVKVIKDEIKNGTYNRNSKLVAQKIVDYFKGREI